MAKHVCPVWVAYLLANPLRKLIQDPKRMLGPFVKEGMIVLDVGCAMGFFSLPLAEMVGGGGSVICVDVQEKMLNSLRKRADKAGLSDKIKTHLADEDSLGLNDLKEGVDFALAFAVVHEVRNAGMFFSEIYDVIKPGGSFLVAEPRLHVSETDVEISVYLAEKQGFRALRRFHNVLDWGVLLGK